MAKLKRAVKDIPIITDKVFVDLQALRKNFNNWNYKNANEQITLRDKALFCALILMGPRASEISKLRKEQFYIKPTEIKVVNVETVKRGNIRREIILPRTGSLAVYTEVFNSWLCLVPDKAYIFPKVNSIGAFLWNKPLGRKRIWQIIKTATGLFPHWFRGVHETIYGRLVLKDAWKLKDFMGLKRVDSTEPYIRGELEAEDLKRLKTL